MAYVGSMLSNVPSCIRHLRQQAQHGTLASEELSLQVVFPETEELFLLPKNPCTRLVGCEANTVSAHPMYIFLTTLFLSVPSPQELAKDLWASPPIQEQ